MKDLNNHKKITVLIDTDNALGKPLLERAIGNIYRPETEPQSHYLYMGSRARCDVAVHLEQTTELEPLDRTGGWDQQEPTETLPFSI